MRNNRNKHDISVLIVEDDFAALTFMQTLVGMHVQTVFTAQNGKQGLEQFRRNKPDLIISDIGMPEMNGIEMSEIIKIEDEDAYIILTTAFDSKSILLKAIEIGISEYLVKPIRKEYLERSLLKAAERINIEKELYRKNESIMTLYRAVESTSNIVKILAVDGTIEYVNPRLFELTGDKAENLIGKNIADFPPDEISRKSFQNMIYALNSGKEWKGDIRRTSKKDKILWLQNSLSAIKNEMNEITHYVMVSEDITLEKKRQEELSKLNDILESKVKQRTLELEKAKDIAEAANKAKSMFLAKVSHELRTPMNGILGMTSLLLNNEEDPKKKHSLSVVKQSGDSLLTIINDILDIAKIEAGKFKLDKFSFQPKQTIQNDIEILKNLAEKKNIDLELIYDDKIPQVLIGDGNRFQQIINNLVGNAIKFTEKGFVKLTFKNLITDEDHTRILISVEDTGIGIENDKKNELFESFTQIEDTMTRKHGGTGLGLSITKEIVDAMNGEIWFESEKNKGSIFYANLEFELDMSFISDNHVNMDNIDQSINELDSVINILIAEDSIINQEVINEIFSEYNQFNIEIVENGVEAVTSFKNNDYDLILMDVQMPMMDGFKASEIINEIEKSNTETTPIIFLTAHAGEDNIAECMKNGAVDVLTKPFKKDNLIKMILKYNKQNYSKMIIDLSQLIRSINYKEEVLNRIINHFKKNVKSIISDIRMNYSTRNYTNLRFLIHKLKSEVGNLGAYNAEKSCSEISDLIKNNENELLYEKINELEFELNKINDYFEKFNSKEMIKQFG